MPAAGQPAQRSGANHRHWRREGCRDASHLAFMPRLVNDDADRAAERVVL
jgi:hypothetical protein